MKLACYVSPTKSNARAMLQAFAEASGAELVDGTKFLADREAVFWGVDRSTLGVWERVLESGQSYWFIDNGYFKARWTGGDHYRVTRNATQHGGSGDSTGERWRALKLQIAPWRDGNRHQHVLVAVQSDFWHIRHGHGNADDFASNVQQTLRCHTKRRIVLRGKPIAGHTEPPLAEHFKDCWAVVTHSSMVAAEALLAGIPAFCLARNGALATVTHGDLTQIEGPIYPPDRERWASVLADNQWALAELRAGVAWRALRGNG